MEVVKFYDRIYKNPVNVVNGFPNLFQSVSKVSVENDFNQGATNGSGKTPDQLFIL